MEAQNLEFFPLGDTPAYKNTWNHTFIGIGGMALAILVLYFIGKPSWHPKLLIVLTLWTGALLITTLNCRFVTKIWVNLTTREVTIHYFTLKNAENAKTFNLKESDISYKYTGGKFPVWQLIISDEEASFKLSTPFIMSFKTSRNKFTKEDLDKLNTLLSS